jgi:hypothetical protein
VSISTKKTWIAVVTLGLLILPLVLVLAQAKGRAALRLTPGFVPLVKDARVFYEPGAEGLAGLIADALPESVTRVEDWQSRPFRPGFRVYIPASHERFTRHAGLPADSPVRGLAFAWDVWLSPKSFDFHGKDTHISSLTHELSHLHLGQHLGWIHRNRHIPKWFYEGLADWVAGTGDEIVSRSQALEALVSGRKLVPDAMGRLPLPKGALDYGLSWPMFHMQSRLFVEYLSGSDHASFAHFVAALLDGDRFDVAFTKHFRDDLETVWARFLDGLAGYGQ